MVCAGRVGAERIRQLLGKTVGDRITLNADRTKRRVGPMEGSEAVVPDQPELAEVDLGVIEALPMVPAVDFGDTDEVAERPQVVQVGMLEREVHSEDCQPPAQNFGRGAEQAQHQQPRAGHQRRVDWVPTLTVQPIEPAR